MKNGSPGCALLMVVDGFDETEIVTLLSILRRTRVCIKSVGLTSGLVTSAHGVRLAPDLTLADAEQMSKTMSIRALILPEREPALSKLAADPRAHRLLHQVVAQGGQIAAGLEGRQFFKNAGEGRGVSAAPAAQASLIVRELGQSPEAFAQMLLQHLEPGPRV